MYKLGPTYTQVPNCYYCERGFVIGVVNERIGIQRE